jgi:hypothetical protein
MAQLSAAKHVWPGVHLSTRAIRYQKALSRGFVSAFLQSKPCFAGQEALERSKVLSKASGPQCAHCQQVRRTAAKEVMCEALVSAASVRSYTLGQYWPESRSKPVSNCRDPVRQLVSISHSKHFSQKASPKSVALHSLGHHSNEKTICRSTLGTTDSHLTAKETNNPIRKQSNDVESLKLVEKLHRPVQKAYLEMTDQLVSYLMAQNNEEGIFKLLREETGKLPGAGASMQVGWLDQFSVNFCFLGDA